MLRPAGRASGSRETRTSLGRVRARGGVSLSGPRKTLAGDFSGPLGARTRRTRGKGGGVGRGLGAGRWWGGVGGALLAVWVGVLVNVVLERLFALGVPAGWRWGAFA